jgi:nicotinamidase-related amidase
MQRDVVGHAYNVDAVTANIRHLVDTARAQGVAVIWVQHSDDAMPRDSQGWRCVPALVQRDDEPLVHKTYGDAFEETDLESVLAERSVGHVVVTGAQTDQCIRSTLHGALVRGYDATLVGDAHTTEDLREWGASIGPDDAIAYTNLYWGFTEAPGRRAVTVPTADVDFGAG